MTLMLKRLALLAAGIFVGVIVGVACTYSVMHRVNQRWIELRTERRGLAWANEVFSESDIPLPNQKDPQGQAKFVDRGIGKGYELGYVVSSKMEKLDQSKLPEKYKKSQPWGEFTVGPTESVTYSGHLEFSLKDADAFELMTTESNLIYIESGEENKLQGFAKDSIPEALVRRTKTIWVTLVLDKCETFRP
ncbi:MAG TPA: hypothetical protein VE077_20785 [Candidatus Methylomirabilis sp.]|nr:hypothetical protein [Candidatus Methylomirabilis sp.]